VRWLLVIGVLRVEELGGIPPVDVVESFGQLENLLELLNLVRHIIPSLVQQLLVRVWEGPVVLLPLNVGELGAKLLKELNLLLAVHGCTVHCGGVARSTALSPHESVLTA
jgi:hypothetical protein